MAPCKNKAHKPVPHHAIQRRLRSFKTPQRITVRPSVKIRRILAEERHWLAPGNVNSHGLPGVFAHSTSKLCAACQNWSVAEYLLGLAMSDRGAVLAQHQPRG